MSKYYEHSGNTTEWDDILIKKGITTREEVLLSKGLNPLDYMEKEEEEFEEGPTKEEVLANLNLDEIDELLDDEDLDEDHLALEKYRKQRLEEMKKTAVTNRFGEVVEIVKDEWIREVTEGSKSSIVLVHLYSDAMIECQLMDEALKRLAPKFRYLKFLRIKYNQAIENWPEKNLPTVFIYEKGNLRTQIITLNALGGKSMTAQDLEWHLVKQGIITDSELDEDPRTVERTTVKKTLNSSRLRNYGSDEDSDA
eukprot:gene3241-3454_t